MNYSNRADVGMGALRHTLYELFRYRELILTLTWRNIVVAYKQSYLGIGWIICKPLLLTLIFTLVRSFVGIESGEIPYPILTFAALMPWLLFQEATASSVNSVTENTGLIQKIYFPREVFPLTVLTAKLVDLAVNFVILAAMMIYYKMPPTVYMFWAPLIILYTLVLSLAVGLAGSALNVYYRDVSKGIPVLLQLMMYASPVIYPLSLVKKTLIEDQSAGDFSQLLYWIYMANPMAGIIDAYQKSVLYGQAPDFAVLMPGIILTCIVLPVSYSFFKKVENRFADVI